MKDLEELLKEGNFEIRGENGEVFKSDDLRKKGIEVYVEKTEDEDEDLDVGSVMLNVVGSLLEEAEGYDELEEKALELKGDHKIYYHDVEDFPDGDICNAAEIADLSKCIKGEDGWVIPDDCAPNWLLDIIDLYGGCELMETVFEFPNRQAKIFFQDICDVVD